MPNEITSILQPSVSQHRPSARAQGQVHSASQPAVVENTATSKGDRVSLTDSARQLQLAESKSERSFASRPHSSDAGLTSVPTNGGEQPASIHLTAQGNTQHPSPAMANMMAAFFTTSGMEGFDVNSDLNADGVINFLDLGALKAKETGIGDPPSDSPKAMLHNMTEAFFSSEGGQDFHADSDLNNDGTINFLDLGILRAKMENS